ncbi:MAG: adenylate/guanylate cyclase domain-containing protein [Cyanobacteria bacterium REEB65]|nr:adenylate/guanylate cyclase domain-containing protein [Cyanobacteria bacterium REEB65]
MRLFWQRDPAPPIARFIRAVGPQGRVDFKGSAAGVGRDRPASGECDATVLFADLEGFTGMAERLPPHEVVATLNEAFALMADCVLAERGIVDKFIGDAMLVYWASADIQEDALAAARASLAIVSKIERLQARRLKEGKRPTKVRIGLASGRVVVGDIGAPIRYDRTIIGDPVNLANRLESLNKVFHTDILLSGPARVRLGEAYNLRDLGRVAVKGRREPVEVFALLGAAATL